MRIIKWVGRIISLFVLVVALPFYFGYGNPLPFVKPDYSLWENFALSIIPLIFVSLALGWKYPKLAGWLIIFLIISGFTIGLSTDANMSINLAAPIIPGIIYLAVGYKKYEKKN